MVACKAAGLMKMSNLCCLGLVAGVLGACIEAPGASTATQVDELSIPLVGRWLLDEGSGTTVTDSSGAGHNGTINGAAYAVGRSSYGLAFDGISNYVGIPINIPETEFTIAVWFKTASANGTIFAAVDPVTSSSSAWDRQIGMQSGKLCHRIWSDQTYCSTANVNDNVWHQATVTVGAAAGGKLYLDGVEVASGNKTASDFTWQTGVVLGNQTAWGAMAGLIDDLEIYSGVLSATEVATLYSQGAATDGGSGLTGQYYDNIDLIGLELTRNDSTVNFNWGTGSPDFSVGSDTFSVRWTGRVQPLYSQTYTFYTTSDDGIRLWINNQQIINNWTDHNSTVNTGTISLQASVKYDIKLEFYDNGGGAQAQLEWSSASQARQIIPRGRLFPARPAVDSPLDQRQRIGAYAWGMDTTSWPGAPDLLTWGSGKVAAAGSRTFRGSLGAANAYNVNPPGSPTLAQVAASSAWDALFRSSSFDTYVLTTYSANDMNGNWTDGYTPAEQLAGRQEILDFANYLLSTYTNKTFIISNWEMDNAVSYTSGSQTVWDGAVDWINARTSGIEQARRQNPNATSRIYSSLQFNLLRSLSTGAGCDEGTTKCAISYVGPRVLVDVYDYSSYQSINAAQGLINSTLQADLTTALSKIQARRPAFTAAEFMVGEFGFPRDAFGECNSAARSSEVLNGLEQWGASLGVQWQALDNPLSLGPWAGFGLYKNSGALSLMGRQFQTLYQTQSITIPPSSCPGIVPNGIVNGVTWDQNYHPGDMISIFGNNTFSSSGNKVQIHQGSNLYTVTAGSMWWYESPNQINAMLPAGVVSGPDVEVYVTDANGIDSNGLLINIQ
jgi:hypothetical protein